MATGDGTREYYESLPGKRIGAGLVSHDAGNRVLLVQPTYKPAWELPGGVVEAGESPAACAAREVSSRFDPHVRTAQRAADPDREQLGGIASP